MTTTKKSLTIRKDIQVPPKSPKHRVQQLSRNKSQSKNKTKSRVKDIVISKEAAKRFNHLMGKNTVTVHISPQKTMKRTFSKSKSLKKSKAEKSKPKKRSKNIYTQNDNNFQDNFLQSLTERSFDRPQKFKFGLLSHIFKYRIVRDTQFDELYEKLLTRFPDRQKEIRNALFQIISTLDS